MMVLRELEEQIVRMGALAERILATATRAVAERNADLARSIEKQDLEIDRIEVDLDAGILRALALRAPVAEELRRVIAVKSMAIDLERVGDLARNIARSGERLIEHPVSDLPARLEPLQREATQLLRRALDAFQAKDPDAARGVIARDDYIDALHAEIVEELVDLMGRRPAWVPQGVDAIRIAESLERVADHATNIAEDVILVAEARNVKHAEKLA